MAGSTVNISFNKELLAEIEDLTDLVEPKKGIDAILDDPDDNRVLECAVESGANGIISGDSHLLALRSFGKIEIMNPVDFLRRFRKNPVR